MVAREKTPWMEPVYRPDETQKRKDSEAIESHIEQFLKDGGKIKEIPMYVSGRTEKKPKARYKGRGK